MKHTKHFTVLALASALAACGDSGSSLDSSSTGTFSLDVTDAPTDQFEKVWITFTGVTLLRSEGEPIVFDFDEPRTLDLLQLQGGETASLLDDVEVEAGDYQQIRLTLDVDNSFVEETDGSQKTLFIPSGAQSGLKLVSGFTVAQDSSTNFTIDFDARKSIIDPQSSAVADYFLRPTLRLVNNVEAGAITGTVDASTVIQTECADSSAYSGMVYVFEGAEATTGDLGSENEPLVAVPVSDEDEPGTFTYKAAFLLEGDYTVAYSCSPDDNEIADETFTFVETQNNISVEAGTETTVNFGG